MEILDEYHNYDMDEYHSVCVGVTERECSTRHWNWMVWYSVSWLSLALYVFVCGCLFVLAWFLNGLPMTIGCIDWRRAYGHQFKMSLAGKDYALSCRWGYLTDVIQISIYLRAVKQGTVHSFRIMEAQEIFSMHNSCSIDAYHTLEQWWTFVWIS